MYGNYNYWSEPECVPVSTFYSVRINYTPKPRIPQGRRH